MRKLDIADVKNHFMVARVIIYPSAEGFGSCEEVAHLLCGLLFFWLVVEGNNSIVGCLLAEAESLLEVLLRPAEVFCLGSERLDSFFC